MKQDGLWVTGDNYYARVKNGVKRNGFRYFSLQNSLFSTEKSCYNLTPKCKRLTPLELIQWSEE